MHPTWSLYSMPVVASKYQAAQMTHSVILEAVPAETAKQRGYGTTSTSSILTCKKFRAEKETVINCVEAIVAIKQNLRSETEHVTDRKQVFQTG